MRLMEDPQTQDRLAEKEPGVRLTGGPAGKTRFSYRQDRSDRMTHVTVRSSARPCRLVKTIASAIGAMLVASCMLGRPAVTGPPKAGFATYPATEHFRGKPKAPRLTGLVIPDRYRPLILEAARQGPNFAGAYTVATYGCGTGCEAVLVIGARSGKVYKAPVAATYGVTFKRSSRLLVLNADPVHRLKPRYFVFDQGRFDEI